MNLEFQGWPASARTAALSLLVIGLAYSSGAAGQIHRHRSASAHSRAEPEPWIDAVVRAVGRRVPFWSVLVGIYIAAGFWVLAPNIATTLDKALYVIAAASLTFLVAEVLVKLVRTHGSTIDPSLPEDDTHRESRSNRRRHPRPAGHSSRAGACRSRRCSLPSASAVSPIALALQDTLANLFAGFYLTVAKQIRIGNYIRLSSGEEGYLVDIDGAPAASGSCRTTPS